MFDTFKTMSPSEHDAFHRPTTDDPWWQETAWFTLMVPERSLSCYVYPWVKANQGILGGGVMVWDDRGRHPWDALHWDYQWTYPYPELGDLRDITFPTGIRMQCLEPLTKYRVTYDHPRCSIDVTFDAILPAHVLGEDDDTSGTFSGHLDQQGHVTGAITLDGERLDVDCYAMRDRSWGRRGSRLPDSTSGTTSAPRSTPRSSCSRNRTRRAHPWSRTSGTSGATANRCHSGAGAACSSATASGRAA